MSSFALILQPWLYIEPYMLWYQLFNSKIIFSTPQMAVLSPWLHCHLSRFTSPINYIRLPESELGGVTALRISLSRML